MTADERDLTPEDEAEVARLLAESGGPLPTPTEVVARLDDVLAGLVAERAAGNVTVESADVTGTVLPLSTERRRRWPRALLAAAAVVAGGYGVGVALTGTSMSGDASSTTAADGSAAGESAESEADEAGPDGAGASSDRQSVGGLLEPDAAALRDGLPRLSSDHLARDVGRLLGDGEERREASGRAELAEDIAPRRAAGCVPSTLRPADTWYLVRYDGRRAALVTATRADGTVRASVLGCDGERLDAVTVRTR